MLKGLPIDSRIYGLKEITSLQGLEFQGNSPPGLFVSHTNYPKVTISPMTPVSIVEDSDLLDNPERWFGRSLEELIAMRSSLLRSTKLIKTIEARNPGKELSLMQETVMSEKPVDLEIHLKKKPSLKMDFDSRFAPLGPSAPLKKISLESNPKIPRAIDYLASDGEVKSSFALNELYSKGIKIHSLYKLLSCGTLGVQKNRVLVPTKWSITAVDDSVSKKLIEKIKYYREIDSIQLFQAEHLWNKYWILFLPRPYSYEMLEAWIRENKSLHETEVLADSEFFEGRKKYASEITGAYYSGRLAIAEYLEEIKRQASAIIFREVQEEYKTSLGTWQIREAVRHAFQKKPLEFQDLNLALNFISTKLRLPLNKFKEKSKLLDNVFYQKQLKEWM